MESNKEYRFKDNPKEKEFHDKFIKMFKSDRLANTTLSAIVFGWENDKQHYPKEILTEREESICCNLIQWLGSPVGQGFLDSCGFVQDKENSNTEQNG